MSSRENDPKVKESSTSESAMPFFLCTPLNATLEDVEVGDRAGGKYEILRMVVFIHLEAFLVRAVEGRFRKPLVHTRPPAKLEDSSAKPDR